MKTKTKSESNQILPYREEFHFNFNRVLFVDLKKIYEHFNMLPKEKVITKEQLFNSWDPVDNLFVERMSNLAALLGHNCIRLASKKVYIFGKEYTRCFAEYNQRIKFDFDFCSDYEDYCEDEIGVDSLINKYGIEKLAPIFVRYPFRFQISEN